MASDLRAMRKTSLIAASLALALAGAPVVTVASATTLPDPIAHAATQRDRPSPAKHRGHKATSPSSTDIATGTDGTPGGAHAYGKDCASESHQHVAGHPGTPFSECVHALKTVAAGTSHSARRACKAEPHKHVKGEKGTPFSRCVAAARKVAHAKQHTQATRRTASGPR